MPFSIGSADLSVLVGVAEVVLCSEDHTPKESQQRYVYMYMYLLCVVPVSGSIRCTYIMTLESVMELWGIGYGCFYCRLWLESVVQVMLCAPWKTRKMAALCLSQSVQYQPQTALMLLGILEATQEKVGVYYTCLLLMMS